VQQNKEKFVVCSLKFVVGQNFKKINYKPQTPN